MEDKLEFEENDLAISFLGQESIRTDENFKLLRFNLKECEFAELKLRQEEDMNGKISTAASVTSCNGTCDGAIMENGRQATPAEAGKSTEVPHSPLPVQIVPRNEDKDIKPSSECSSAPRTVFTDAKEQENGMKNGVKKRKNIFTGFVGAKFGKAFVSKIVIV